MKKIKEKLSNIRQKSKENGSESDETKTKSSSNAAKRDKKGAKKVIPNDKKNKKNSSTTDVTMSEEVDETEVVEESEEEQDMELHEAKPDKKFGKTIFVDTDKKGTWHVLVRIIEGRDLTRGVMRVRASLDGQQKATRACSEGNSTWRQNLTFSQKNMTLEMLATQLLNLKVTRVGRLREHVEGLWSVSLSAVLHSTNRAVISKWISLRSLADEESDDEDGDHAGFLKVSICIYSANDSPPHLNDDKESEEVWSGAQLEEHTLRIRLYRLHHIAEEVKEFAKEKSKRKKVTFFLKVIIGDESLETSNKSITPNNTHEYSTETVNFDQDLFIPILWPTVVAKIRFCLYMKKGRRMRCLGESSIALRSIYEPGEDGCMPVFGPAFLNFYGHEIIQRLKFRKESETISEGSGSKYLARILCSVETVEYMGDTGTRSELMYSTASTARQFETLSHYRVYCTFFACNLINPIFGSSNVSFHLSVGDFGSTSTNQYRARCSTFGAMPDTDKHKYFFMPWGNHKPIADVPCLWENVEHRITRQNAIRKVTLMLNEMITAVRNCGDTNPSEAASIAMEAMDHMEEMMDRLKKYKCTFPKNELDKKLETFRLKTLKRIMKELEGVRSEMTHIFDETTEHVIRLLTRLKDALLRLSMDAQVSLPHVTIKMVADAKVVAFCHVHPSDIFYNSNDALCGEFCGEIRPLQMQWPTLVDRKNRREEFPATVHVKMWFGKSEQAMTWNEMTQPAEIKSYLEVFRHERKSKLNRVWKPWDGPEFSDEHGLIDMTVAAQRKTFGWNHLGNWVSRQSHDMWIPEDSGRNTVIDRAYVVEQRTKDGGWERLKYTDFFGGEPEIKMKQAPEGWQYVDNWTVDRHMNNGDKSGYVYSIDDNFWGENGTVDKVARPSHQYRRRCIARTRKATNYNKDAEELMAFEKSLEERKWEFAANFSSAWHSDEIQDASVRRRRYLVEVEREEKIPVEKQHEAYYLSRMFEVHRATTTWQLRCYILWAKDLLPVIKTSSCAFVRITFLTRAQQTLIVANSQNPVWCESLVFDKVPIPGGKRQIVVNPPTISVEVRGEKPDDSELFLGRFEVQPTVISGPMDSRAQPQWNTLLFQKGKTRGAVLASFELFHQDPRDADELPLLPMRKSQNEDRYEVPAEMRPKFDRFTIQFLCWGVRNLSKHRLLPVRRPFLEILVGDKELRTEPLKNASKDPNLPEPLITFPEVSLPSSLELSPPMVVNLYDSRAFHRRPLVGLCHISNFNKYMRVSMKKKNESSDKGNWKQFDELVFSEDMELSNTVIRPSIQQEGKPRIDWWSKYYASQFRFERAPGFEESGMEHLTIYKCALENAEEYNNFGDFLDTFTFVKSAKGNFDDPEEKEKTGELKGKLFITRLTEEKPELIEPPGVEFVGPVKCILRVYVIESFGLQSVRKNGIIDPYILVRYGKQKISLKHGYKSDTSEPVFGEMIEMEVTVPLEKDLTISIMDRRKILADEEIGSTKIDIENRLLTKWRATVGFSRQFTLHGEYGWRDQLNPLMALKRYCIKMQLPPPEILKKDANVGLKLLGIEFWMSDVIKAQAAEDKSLLEHLRKAGGKDSDEATQKEKEEKEGRMSNVRDAIASAVPPKLFHWLLKKNTNTPPPTAEQIVERRKVQRAAISGRPLQAVALHILQLMKLVPEHVETRQLFTGMGGNRSCGEVRMFVDLFPLVLGPVPPPIDIAPRKPDIYQLRIAVFNVSNCIAIKRSFGDPVCDPYVKVFVNGMLKSEKTDVHYRCLDGVAEFNWRFVLDVHFNPWEQKVVSYRKTRMFRKAREELVAPLIIVELWDKHRVRKDRKLGEIMLDMTDFKEGLSDPGRSSYGRKKVRKGCCNVCSKRCCMTRCCIFCWSTRCGCKMRKTAKPPMPKAPRYIEPEDDHESVSLFETGVIRGWWPMVSSDVPEDQKLDETSRKKKDDDYDPDALYVMGMVELEMSLLGADEAAADPVGKKRKDPNHSPYLPKPYRSKWNSFWITSRIKPFCHWMWHKFLAQWLCWILVILLIALIIFAIVNNWPVLVVSVTKAIVSA